MTIPHIHPKPNRSSWQARDAEKDRQQKLISKVPRALFKRMIRLEPVHVKIASGNGDCWAVQNIEATFSSPSHIVGVTVPTEEEALRLGRIMKIAAIRNTISEAHDMGRKSPDFLSKLVLRFDLGKIRDLINGAIEKAQETPKQAKQ